MLQAILKKGRVLTEEMPNPVVRENGAIIKVAFSCISAGTELGNVKNSGKSLIKRVLEQPDNVRKAMKMASREGVVQTVGNINRRYGSEKAIGYSLSGIVLATGNNVSDLQPGDRVAAAGAGIANHAEYVDVPRNLIIPILDMLDFKSASTVALGGIAMQSVRRANVALGEFAVVYGAGILGQLAIGMLRNSGARVIAIDLDRKRLKFAEDMGAELCVCPDECNHVEHVYHYTQGCGADVVLFCAATSNSAVLSDAFKMVRKKGRLVMVGVWGKDLRREDIYAKELDFLISTGYGPGRYDPQYEERGVDYPYAYVRWTENRNMQEYLRLLSQKRLNIDSLIQETWPLEQVDLAFASLEKPQKPVIVLLEYGEDIPGEYSTIVRKKPNLEVRSTKRVSTSREIRVGIIGVGNFATGIHLPNLKRLKGKYRIDAICARSGISAKSICNQYNAGYATTDYREILGDHNIDLVMICTRHDLHGKMVLEGLKAGKHVFVEKPLCITQEELDEIKDLFSAWDSGSASEMPVLMVGFNRRFSAYAQEIKRHILSRVNPLIMSYRMNAGFVPLDHWVHGEEGGGRIIGEACHIVDFFSFLTDSEVKAYSASSLRPMTDSISHRDNRHIVLEYEDGSIGCLQYFSIGASELPKERLEIHFDGKSIVMEDFKSLYGYGLDIDKVKGGFDSKGHLAELERLYDTIVDKKNPWPIDLIDMIRTTEVTLHAA